MPTATRTSSSSSLSPQLAMGNDSNQSPICGASEAKYRAICDGSTIDALTTEQLACRLGRSQKDCLLGNGSGGIPNDVDQSVR